MIVAEPNHPSSAGAAKQRRFSAQERLGALESLSMTQPSDQQKPQAPAVTDAEMGPALGTLVLPIADELVEVLTAIASYLAAGRVLLERDESPERAHKVRDALELAYAQTSRAATAVNRIRHLASSEGGGRPDKP